MPFVARENHAHSMACRLIRGNIKRRKPMNSRLAPPQIQVSRSRRPFQTNSLIWFLALFAAASTVIRAQDKFIAYVVPADTAGNQDFGGTLGMDFDVQNAVLITQLGVFDDKSDGLKLPIAARLYDRSTDPPTELVSV